MKLSSFDVMPVNLSDMIEEQECVDFITRVIKNPMSVRWLLRLLSGNIPEGDPALKWFNGSYLYPQIMKRRTSLFGKVLKMIPMLDDSSYDFDHANIREACFGCNPSGKRLNNVMIGWVGWLSLHPAVTGLVVIDGNCDPSDISVDSETGIITLPDGVEWNVENMPSYTHIDDTLWRVYGS